jgi:AraC-like DNA-binding protein
MYILHEGALFVGSGVRNQLHRHFSASLIFTLDAPFRVRFGKAGWRTTRGVVVAPNVAQAIDASRVRMVVLQIDPETQAYGRVAGLLVEHGPFYELPPALADTLTAEAHALLHAPSFEPDRLWRLALERTCGIFQPRSVDPRISQVLGILKRDILSPPGTRVLADAVGLSPSRLIHLFKESMGLTVRRYLQWLRMRQVIVTLVIGRTLTEAAHVAGFADSAHLSRTFRAMYGMPLNSVFRCRPRVELVVGMPDEPLPAAHEPHDSERWASVARALKKEWRPSGS